ncbi:uncharacterized protein CIMG_04190 [Coccidioides immitis RS]|uniref:DUF7598 domain-containing protein n=3 Tax=Coccidioides immitis TaxID=5501 RepID=J3KCZ6_COCIM|nr:uncharacterized protein CIMG_04190 [Coccidioides immitis RS]EAS33166.3 hypothetical protein CIMG_04190 [Coccidioides immitis RS]KMP08459.1 hypothetical protein CIRG_08140 [Coccidioides immitis RMSCC 2394]KMU87274.1 hypothetical protein CIHG_04719 [Coccidioides immitis H538.4]TPX20071.1 hypothetical protein DIZ76_017868 [Coccidioides immitis]
MALIKQPLAGPGYVILNVVRVMNIIALLSVIAACAVMLVKTFIVSKFFLFDAVTHVVVASVSLFLIVSELNIFRAYFNRNWPLLGQNSGFVTLGTTMIVLGVSTLGNLNKEATSQKSLGLAFWRIVISSGIVVIIVGVVNVIVSFVFQDRNIGVTARHVRAHGAVAEQKVITRDSSHKSFQLSRKDSLPTYRSSSSNYSSPRAVSTRTASVRATPRIPIKISSPINDNQDQFGKFTAEPDLAVPNLAHHPAMYSDRV